MRRPAFDLDRGGGRAVVCAPSSRAIARPRAQLGSRSARQTASRSVRGPSSGAAGARPRRPSRPRGVLGHVAGRGGDDDRRSRMVGRGPACRGRRGRRRRRTPASSSRRRATARDRVRGAGGGDAARGRSRSRSPAPARAPGPPAPRAAAGGRVLRGRGCDEDHRARRPAAATPLAAAAPTSAVPRRAANPATSRGYSSWGSVATIASEREMPRVHVGQRRQSEPRPRAVVLLAAALEPDRHKSVGRAPQPRPDERSAAARADRVRRETRRAGREDVRHQRRHRHARQLGRQGRRQGQDVRDGEVRRDASSIADRLARRPHHSRVGLQRLPSASGRPGTRARPRTSSRWLRAA